jgi:dTDP-4-dehydrorhamnose 3,5-epimerase
MRRIDTPLPGVCMIEPQVFADERGFFYESYHLAKFAELGIATQFVQDNHSRSVRGTLRGLHYQLRRPQAKLCRVVLGEVLDVAVDIRRGSPHFGRWTSVRLSAENRCQVFVPAGFAHGFSVLSESAELIYKCDDHYCPDDDRGIAWNDPDLAIDWCLTEPPTLSERDRLRPMLRDLREADLPIFEA